MEGCGEWGESDFWVYEVSRNTYCICSRLMDCRFVDVEFAEYGGGWKVRSFAFEFDSICWLLNTGGSIVTRDGGESISE